MMIIGCDFHPSYQQIALLDTETGVTEEHKLAHATGEAERFYRRLAMPALVGIEAVGNDQWFLDLLEALGHEVWVGDPAQIRASYVRKQKTDRRDAKHILRLISRDLGPDHRDARSSSTADSSTQAGSDTYASKERAATSDAEPGNAEKAEAVEHGRSCCIAIPSTKTMGRSTPARPAYFGGHAANLASSTRAWRKLPSVYPQVGLLMSQPGVGAVTALAFLLTVEDVCRFRRAKRIASYLGLIPREYSSGGKQRMGGISKQGNPLLRFLLVESANIAVRFDAVPRKEYLHRCHQKHPMVAKVAAARKLAIRLYWILRTQIPYPQVLSSRVA
jgi:hypothetical protein